ncbi:MAG: hypothetical protein COV46_01775 [Deltaproteobacteria bacterium CG11_big_fil_rev_8_21_14_0_20_49_13]|nr:MAG: hypothetical protein COV46_01775 [Deltaproteobacteria bacterium CG11_big_fil_rev_8_21_14_0_20_49_13]
MIIEFELNIADVSYTSEEFEDRRGFRICVRELNNELIHSLIDLYENFDFESQFQGVPPLNIELRKAWLQGLLRRGYHIVATLGGGEIVGHAVLMELPTNRSCEFIVVVMKEHRNNGIGTKLCEASIKWARILRFKSMWLTVSGSNSHALHIYKKVGFHLTGHMEADMEMEIDVTK